MGVDKDTFRQIMGCFAAGVTVVTTVDAGGAPYGLTATAFCSVSLEPPLALVCIGKETGSYEQFAAAEVFAVNFLSDAQADVSQRFAKSGGDKFAGLEWHGGELGAPLLGDTVGHAECRIVDAHPGGDHTIFVGRVETGAVRDGSPLTYFRSAYRKLTDL